MKQDHWIELQKATEGNIHRTIDEGKKFKKDGTNRGGGEM